MHIAEIFRYFFLIYVHIQSDSLLDQQILRGDSGHEDKHYWIGNHGAQMSSLGAGGI